MALTIVKHSSNVGIQMCVTALLVKKVKNPQMFVMATTSAADQQWPEILRHNGQEYTFKQIKPVPVMVRDLISGYAMYEIQN